MNVNEINEWFCENSSCYVDIRPHESCLDGYLSIAELRMIINAMEQLEHKEKLEDGRPDS